MRGAISLSGSRVRTTASWILDRSVGGGVDADGWMEFEKCLGFAASERASGRVVTVSVIGGLMCATRGRGDDAT
jgi:hypothetical protein